MRGVKIIGIIVAISVAIGAVFFIFGDAPTPPITQPDLVNTVPVSFTELARGTQSGVKVRTNYIISDQLQLSELWNMIDTTKPKPTVDFTQNVVLAVFFGEQPTAGYSIEISKIEDTVERRVTILMQKPGGSCFLAQKLTNPYQVVVVSKTTLPLVHEDHLNTFSCLE